METQIKVRIGKWKYPIKLIEHGSRFFLSFGYNPELIQLVKSMSGAKWHGFDDPPIKMWSIANNARNRFQLDFLQGKNPYAKFDLPLLDVKPKRENLFPYQVEMFQHVITRQTAILACEMGTGKTLVSVEAMEYFKNKYGLKSDEYWYVAPKVGITAAKRDYKKWNAELWPGRFMTYEELAKGALSTIIPRAIVFDECSKIKNPTSQRSKAAASLVNIMKDKYGDDIVVILMSGTPAPKSPTDWWNQCEVACPGFLKEGDPNKFKARMCLIKQRESASGGMYPHIITWYDDENKCAECGQYEDHNDHLTTALLEGTGHTYKKSKNEVAYLNERLKGLVIVKFKRECIKYLPEKQYEEILLTPPADLLRAAKLVPKRVSRAITALSVLRQLSDGFQYHETQIGDKDCTKCKGTGISKVPVMIEESESAPWEEQKFEAEFKDGPCDNCDGTGKVAIYENTTEYVNTPKDEAFIDELDNMEEIGRYIVWGGFTATVDKLVKLAQQQCWAVLRYDGTRQEAFDCQGKEIDLDKALCAMDLSDPNYKSLLEEIPKLCFVGNAMAGGMALTLTASPVELFYSNSFDGTARMQAEDRFHRVGMDINKGATIKDLLLLPSDKLVLDNLKKKKRLQDLTMGQLEDAFRHAS